MFDPRQQHLHLPAASLIRHRLPCCHPHRLPQPLHHPTPACRESLVVSRIVKVISKEKKRFSWIEKKAQLDFDTTIIHTITCYTSKLSYLNIFCFLKWII